MTNNMKLTTEIVNFFTEICVEYTQTLADIFGSQNSTLQKMQNSVKSQVHICHHKYFNVNCQVQHKITELKRNKDYTADETKKMITKNDNI